MIQLKTLPEEFRSHTIMNKIRKKIINKILIISALIAIILFILMLIIFPPSRGRITNNNHAEVCEKTFLDINGTKLGMVIKGAKADNPVLLFMGGGPGIPEYWMEYEYPTGIDEYFTVCYLCYRGTALSYDPDLPLETITSEQMKLDAVEVTDYLRKRFDQEKIYLIGHSFGTTIALKLASEYPEKYEAYIAMGMSVDKIRSERKAYHYMLEQYKKDGNKKMVSEMEQYYDLFSDENSEPDMSSEKMHSYFAKTRDKAMHENGVGTLHNMGSVITGIFFPTLKMTDFTQKERLNIWRGKSFVSKAEISSGNFKAVDVTKRLDIPFYVLAGKYDMTTDYELQKEYFELVQADIKGFYTFENSAHSPLFEEPERAKEILSKDVINKKNDLSDSL